MPERSRHELFTAERVIVLHPDLTGERPIRQPESKYPICSAVLNGATGPLLRGVAHPLAGPVEEYFARNVVLAPANSVPHSLTFRQLAVAGRLIIPWVGVRPATMDDPLVGSLLGAIGRGTKTGGIRDLYGKEAANSVFMSLDARACVLDARFGEGYVDSAAFTAAELAVYVLCRPGLG